MKIHLLPQCHAHDNELFPQNILNPLTCPHHLSEVLTSQHINFGDIVKPHQAPSFVTSFIFIISSKEPTPKSNGYSRLLQRIGLGGTQTDQVIQGLCLTQPKTLRPRFILSLGVSKLGLLLGLEPRGSSYNLLIVSPSLFHSP